eukprot:2339984-Amphidinium_carterae.1
MSPSEQMPQHQHFNRNDKGIPLKSQSIKPQMITRIINPDAILKYTQRQSNQDKRCDGCFTLRFTRLYRSKFPWSH